MASYELEPWHDFFVATAGAAAALIGLLFVAISINLDRILSYPGLAKRAANTLGVLAALLVTSIFSLAPGQSATAVGVEVLGVGLLSAGQTLFLARNVQQAPGAPRLSVPFHVSLVLAPGLALVIGGASLAAGAGGGLYWVLAATVLGLAAAVGNGWVFLVEIQR